MLLLLAAAAVALPVAVSTATTLPPNPTAGTVNVVVELALVAVNAYPVPLVDVIVTAAFTSDASGAVVSRGAFFDGGGVFRVRFAPPSAGTWRWRTSSTVTNDTGLHGVTGAIAVAPYAGANPLYAHGFMRASADGRRLEHGDGTPFRWLGDTRWMAADLELGRPCNAPANASCGAGPAAVFDLIVADRLAKNFTVFQTYFHGDQSLWWEDPGTWSRINASSFQTRLDPMLDALAARGTLAALGVGLHEMSVAMPADALTRLGAYTAARYGAHPLVWITAQEVNAPNANASAWAIVAEQLYYGSQQQPLSAHMWVGPNSSAPFAPVFEYGDKPWHAWFATQGGHTGMGVRTKAHYKAYWDFRSPLTGAPVPFLEAEAMYENIICGPRFAFANDTRIAAWKASLCGSLGFTYGAAAVWLFKYDLADQTGEAYNPNTWWWPNLALPGSTQVGLMSTWLAGVWGGRLAEVTPRFSDPAWCDFADDEATVLATVADDIFVVYSYGAGTALGELRGLAQATYAGAWLDTRTGAAVPLAAPVQPDSSGAWQITAKPSADDYALVLTRQ